MQEDTADSLKGAIRVDAGQLRGHIDEAVRSSVEETLNGLLDAEADQICGAERYQECIQFLGVCTGNLASWTTG
jgi:putative transposase